MDEVRPRARLWKWFLLNLLLRTGRRSRYPADLSRSVEQRDLPLLGMALALLYRRKTYSTRTDWGVQEHGSTVSINQRSLPMAHFISGIRSALRPVAPVASAGLRPESERMAKEQTLTVVHMVPGRMRFKIGRLKGSNGYAQEVQRRLESVPWISEALVNPGLGNLVVGYETDQIAREELLESLASILDVSSDELYDAVFGTSSVQPMLDGCSVVTVSPFNGQPHAPATVQIPALRRCEDSLNFYPL